MPFVERVRTDQVVVGSFYHAPGEPTAAVEWWPEPCVAFTTFGSWEIRCRRGKGEISPDGVLATEAGAEHDCQHPEGADGFGSMPGFYAAFRAAYGITPTAYRARLTA